MDQLKQFKRLWRILKSIPPFGQSVTRAQIQDRLFGDVEPTTTRMLQRDLSQLPQLIPELKVFQNVSREGTRLGHTTYSWGEKGPPVFMGSLGINEVLAFGVLKQIGVDWMPQVMQKALDPFFSEAMDEAQVLVSIENQNKSNSVKKTKRWLKKIHHLPVGVRFKSLPIDKKVELVVHESLLKETCIQIKYQKNQGIESKITLSPQALVRRGDRSYLYAKPVGVHHVKPYLMNRILAAKEVLGHFETVENFDIQEILKKGIAYPVFDEDLYGKKIQLELWVDDGTARWLGETPLSDDQVISTPLNRTDGFYLNATVLLQEELIWWIRSMGGNIQVLGPEIVLDRVKNDLKKALSYYESNNA